jgi:hypothetical protein
MKTTLVILFWCVLAITAIAQDSLIFHNGNRVYGEIKTLDKGVLKIETPYSKDDFTIEWDEVKEIRTSTRFFVTLTSGDRLQGLIRSLDSTQVVIYGTEQGDVQRRLLDIVTMKSGNNKIWDRISASVSLGYSITKAQNARQFSIRGSVGYVGKRWSSDVNYNSVMSKQDDVNDVQRKDGGINYYYFLPKDWYVPVSVSFLSNTEQLLKIRLLAKAGFGKYIVHSNDFYWGVSIGANYNTETYYDDTPGRKTWESFVGTELNLFNIGDLSLLTRIVGYPSITESGRFRTDFSLDTKYDLPLDFYIKLGVTVNYDNRPVEGASYTDYVCQTTFGWTL